MPDDLNARMGGADGAPFTSADQTSPARPSHNRSSGPSVDTAAEQIPSDAGFIHDLFFSEEELALLECLLKPSWLPT